MTLNDAKEFTKFILDNMELNENDLSYVKSVQTQLFERKFISKKQSIILQEMYRRATGGGQYANQG